MPDFESCKYAIRLRWFLLIKYMEINTNEVEMVVNGIHYKMEWEARAVYCDHYTYAKLIKAYNDLV